MTASSTSEVRRSRLKLLALIAVFALPMLVAWVMVTWRIGIPDERTAHGQLAPDLPPLAEWPVEEADDALATGDWILAFDCSSNCEAIADQWWRVHRAMGREAPRVSRLRIGGASAPLPGELVTQWSGRPDWQRSGQVWVLDPRGTVVLTYSDGVDAEDVLADVNRLLRINPEAPVGDDDREVAER